VHRWLERWGPEAVLELVEFNNDPPPLYLRPLRDSLAVAKQRLSSAGFDAGVVGDGVPCLRLEDGTDPARILEVVPGIVQDPGAALVTVYADVPPGELVADLCAAPGGKTLALASGGAYVFAADRSLVRLKSLRDALARVGGRVDLAVALAQAPPLRSAPFVLLDVPCSGTGTFRRHPDARWRLTPDTLDRLVRIQKEILDRSSHLVPAGGHMVYSTCTLEPEENEEQVGGFLMRHPEFSIETTEVVGRRYQADQGYLQVLPQVSGFDGAFAARMVRGS
jgi:16S rRNA (cytosine967-C5)-methyltransferase